MNHLTYLLIYLFTYLLTCIYPHISASLILAFLLGTFYVSFLFLFLFSISSISLMRPWTSLCTLYITGWSSSSDSILYPTLPTCSSISLTPGNIWIKGFTTFRLINHWNIEAPDYFLSASTIIQLPRYTHTETCGLHTVRRTLTRFPPQWDER